MKHPILVLVVTADKVLEFRLVWSTQPLTFTPEKVREQLRAEGEEVEVLDVRIVQLPYGLEPANAAMASLADFYVTAVGQEGSSFRRLLEQILTQAMGFSIDRWKVLTMENCKTGRMLPVVQTSEYLPRG